MPARKTPLTPEQEKQQRLEHWEKPSRVSDVELAFPAHGAQYTPLLEDLPEGFQMGNRGNLWIGFVERWFYSGDPWVEFEVGDARQDVDDLEAWRHLKVVLGTYETKHERKMAGGAYLMSRWFTGIRRVKEQ